jgi:hypothetical protein
MPACTGQLVEASIPTSRSVHGYVEQAENVEQTSGLLIARLFIAENVAAKGLVNLCVVSLHDAPVTLRHGHVADIYSYENDTISDVSSQKYDRIVNSKASSCSDLGTQTDPDLRFPDEYLHLPGKEQIFRNTLVSPSVILITQIRHLYVVNFVRYHG